MINHPSAHQRLIQSVGDADQVGDGHERVAEQQLQAEALKAEQGPGVAYNPADQGQQRNEGDEVGQHGGDHVDGDQRAGGHALHCVLLFAKNR